MRIEAEFTGVTRIEVGLHINHISSFSLKCKNIKALPCQVVARHKGGRHTLAPGPSLTGENRGVAQQKEEEKAQVESGGSSKGEHGWSQREREKESSQFNLSCNVVCQRKTAKNILYFCFFLFFLFFYAFE